MRLIYNMVASLEHLEIDLNIRVLLLYLRDEPFFMQ